MSDSELQKKKKKMDIVAEGIMFCYFVETLMLMNISWFPLFVPHLKRNLLNPKAISHLPQFIDLTNPTFSYLSCFSGFLWPVGLRRTYLERIMTFRETNGIVRMITNVDSFLQRWGSQWYDNVVSTLCVTRDMKIWRPK